MKDITREEFSEILELHNLAVHQKDVKTEKKLTLFINFWISIGKYRAYKASLVLEEVHC
jgi:hypothetical protein